MVRVFIFLKAGFGLGFDHWGTFLGGQKFVHPSADAKGFVFLAGLLIVKFRGIFRDKFAEKSADCAGVFRANLHKSNW